MVVVVVGGWGAVGGTIPKVTRVILLCHYSSLLCSAIPCCRGGAVPNATRMTALPLFIAFI